MNFKTFLLAGFVCLTLLGCAKPLPSEKLNYVGTWVSEDNRVNMMITPEGRIEYSNNQPSRSSSLSSPIKEFNGNDFSAGVGPFSSEFKVSKPPHQDQQGNWFMVVDGNILARVSQ